MNIIYSPEHKNHNPLFEIYDGSYESYAEKPDRLESIMKELLQHEGNTIFRPQSFSLQHIYSLHQKEYVSFIQQRSAQLIGGKTFYPSYFIMDTYTSLVEHTFSAAKKAVDVALTGAVQVLKGERVVYALCRPPGHHAEKNAMGGYCYFNNAAIAANYFSSKGRVAILDIDLHHGNGTQHLFYNRSDIFYISIHADPREKFPYNSGFIHEKGSGSGDGFTKNYPLPAGVGNNEYEKTLLKALRDIKKFQPDFLIVSAGFDTYMHDPIGAFSLTIPFYKTIGEHIRSLDYPTLLIQEGGYNTDDLGKIAWSFLQGFE